MDMNLQESEVREAYRQYMDVMPAVLGRMAAVHVNGSGDAMAPLPYRPDEPVKYPGQDLMDPVVLGYYDPTNPHSQKAIDEAAVIAQPEFNGIRDALDLRQGSAEVIHEAGEHLKAGGNVAMVTRHDNLTDIAYALKMGNDLLRGQGYRPRAQAIVVSEMLPRIGHNFASLQDQEVDSKDRHGEQKDEGVDPIPAMITLQLLCTHILKSYPRTDSTKAEVGRLPNAKTIWTAIGLHNKAMVKALKEQLDEGGVLLGLAPTGTTKVVPKVSGEVELAPLNDGTVDIMSHPSLRILRMLVDYDAEAPYAYLYPNLLNIQGPQDAKVAMDELARANTRGVKDASDSALIARFGGVALG